jgi:hypothetical protein
MKTKTSMSKLGYEETRYFPDDKGNKVFAVDAYVSLCKCIKVEAKDEDEALAKVNAMIDSMLKGVDEMEVGTVLSVNGFFGAEDLETRVSGEADENGEIEYY